MSQAVLNRIQSEYLAKFPDSQQLYERGCKLFPSGVTHDAQLSRAVSDLRRSGSRLPQVGRRRQ